MTTFNLVVVGASGSGKSTLAHQMADNFFEPDSDPIVSKLYQKRLIVDGEMCLVTIEDTAGDSDYADLRNRIRAGDGFLIVFAVTSTDWQNEITYYRNLIRYLKKTPKREKAPPIVLVVSKSDSMRWGWKFEGSDVKAVADLMGAPFVQTSAKLRQGVEYAFDTLIREIRAARDLKMVKRQTGGWSRVRGWLRFWK